MIGSLSAKNLQVIVWIAAVVLLLLGARHIANKLCEAKVANARAEVEEEYRLKADELATRNLESERRLQNAEREIKKLRAAVPDSPACDYPDTAIVQLDKARGVPESASLDARASTAPATYLSGPSAAEQWAEDGIAYQRCKERVDQFIEWHGH